MPIAPTEINSLPIAPDVVNRPSTFNKEANDLFNAFRNTYTPQVNAAALNVYTNSLDAANSANTASTAAAIFNAIKWIDNKNYVVGETVISPAALLANSATPVFICKVDNGGVHIDPYLDATHWTVYSISANSGGAIYTTSTTLNSTSPFSIQISGGSGAWIKLPDATTVAKGMRHTVRNVGDNDVTLIDATGAHIGFIRPQCGTTIALSDNSTAAGKWVGDWEQIGITADFQILQTTAGATNVKQIIQLDATRTLVIVGGSAGQNLAAAVYDTTTQAAGTPVVVRSVSYGAMAIKTATDQLLCVAFDGGNPGNLYASVLTISGTAITVNAAVTAAITGQFSAVGNWVQIGSAWCFSYNNASNGITRAITISGTTPSAGAEQSAAASGAPRLYASGSVLRAVRVNSASTVVCTPYTVSGNTLTAGTPASTATTLADAAVRTLQYSNGDILALHTSGGYYVSSIFRLSTTTEAVNSANIRSHGTLAVASIDLKKSDYSICDATKILFGCTIQSDYSIFSVNHIVNNNGLPSVGTPLDFPNTVNVDGVLEVVSSNGDRGFFITSSLIIINSYYTSFTNLMFFDTSAASPTRTKAFNFTEKIPFAYPPHDVQKSTIGNYNAQLCVNSKGIFNITGLYAISIGTTTPIKITPNTSSAYMIGSSGVQIPYKTQPIFRASGSVRGENNQTTWAVTPLTTAAEGSLGVALQRIEIAQI